MTTDARTRWIALYVLCLGDLMIVLDGTIVNVALPSIRDDLGFTETSIAWVVNAYLLTFGGFLLLGGRLGDLFGYKRLFLIGLSIFTRPRLRAASPPRREFLVASRAVQGFGGAIVSVVALSLIMFMFTEGAERAKAMGLIGFVLPAEGRRRAPRRPPDGPAQLALDLPRQHPGRHRRVRALRVAPARGSRGRGAGGGSTSPAPSRSRPALMLAVYAIVNGNETGWTSGNARLLGVAGVLFGAFLVIESRVPQPLVPLGLFRNRNVSSANVVGVLMAAGCSLVLRLGVLHAVRARVFRRSRSGSRTCPRCWSGAFSRSSSPTGSSCGTGSRRRSSPDWRSWRSVSCCSRARPWTGTSSSTSCRQPSLIGLGGGIGFNPLLLAAMSGVAPTEAGLASGVVNTSFMMGGALGLAVLLSLADSRTTNLLADGVSQLAALNGGYHVAFVVGAIFVVAAASIAAVLFRGGAAPRCRARRRVGAPAAARRVEGARRAGSAGFLPNTRASHTPEPPFGS